VKTLTLAAALFVPMALPAQANVAQLAANANVIGGLIAVSSIRDLSFGTVPKGVATTVAPNAATAGAWQVAGSANADVSITFTLPVVLTNIQALPGSTMPITFLATSARWRRATNDPTGANVFDPNLGVNGRLGPPPNPTLYIWLGGQVNPALTAKPGIYVGTAIVTLVYL